MENQCCSPSYEETFEDFIRKQYEMTLEKMKTLKRETPEMIYCRDMLDLYDKYEN